jgi:hypothetical protein
MAQSAWQRSSHSCGAIEGGAEEVRNGLQPLHVEQESGETGELEAQKLHIDDSGGESER